MVICIGIGLIRSKADLDGGKNVNQPLWKVAVSTFVVTWLNPQALIDGTLMLGAFRASLTEGGNPYFITGFASASFIWFNCLAMQHIFLAAKLTVAS